MGTYVVGNVGGCIGMLGSPILEGSKVRGRPSVTAKAWHQLGRLVKRDGERDVSAQSLGQA